MVTKPQGKATERVRMAVFWEHRERTPRVLLGGGREGLMAKEIFT